MFKAAIRVNKITTISQLRGASLHAQRLDKTGQARVREDAEPGHGIAWSKAENPRDYLAAFKAHKSETGAGERKNAPLCLQALCVVSPEWVEQAGDLHDPENPHNRQLFEQAKAWGESWGGKGSVFGARLDLDEKGGAVVDLMIAPVRESRGKPTISTNKAMVELKGQTNERNEYSALQTSWADWCKETLDPTIERGLRREITQRRHLDPETYGLVMDKARQSLSEAPQRVIQAIGSLDVTREDLRLVEAATGLRGEILRHREEKERYRAPGDPWRDPEFEDEDLGLYPGDDPWPVIWRIRAGAERVVEWASSLGLLDSWGIDKIDPKAGPVDYEVGRDVFANLEDRIHLQGVLHSCYSFCMRVEPYVKAVVAVSAQKLSQLPFDIRQAPQEVEQVHRDLGWSEPLVQDVKQDIKQEPEGMRQKMY